MPDPIDEGREALNGARPSKDLWADATTRAADATVAPLTPLRHPHRRGTWLAVAAAIALVAGTVGILSMNDDDATVDTTPATERPTDGVTTTSIFGSEGCAFGVSGEAVAFTEGPSDPPLFAVSAQPEGQTIAHAALGSQVAEVHVPGLVLDDLIGDRVKDIELSRGTAQLWFGTDFVQVRWFTGSPKSCDSFTVTVAGGTADGNRHAAIDLADRILLPDEIGVEEPPSEADDVAARLQGDWRLYRSTLDGEPTDSVDDLRFTFLDGDASWTDGCNSFSAPYAATGATTFRMHDVVSTKVACPTNAISQAIHAVMGADEIEVDPGVGLGTTYLRLTAGDDELLVGDLPLEETAGVQPGSDGFVWPIILANDEVYDGPFDLSTGQSTALAYAASALGWRDAQLTEGEPSEDGRNGEVFSVTSVELGGWVSVWVDSAPGPVAHVVYRVDVPGRELVAATNISISGTTARIVPGPGPAGTVATTVKLIFDGEVVGEGGPGDAIVLTETPAVPGAVTAYFINADGQALSAWARPLPAGDFIGT